MAPPRVLLACLVGSLFFGLGGCDDPCVTLSELCPSCRDANVKAQCQLIADAPDPDSDACAKALNDGRFDLDCPGE